MTNNSWQEIVCKIIVITIVVSRGRSRILLRLIVFLLVGGRIWCWWMVGVPRRWWIRKSCCHFSSMIVSPCWLVLWAIVIVMSTVIVIDGHIECQCKCKAYSTGWGNNSNPLRWWVSCNSITMKISCHKKL